MIHMTCACGKRMKAGPGLVGRSVKCPQCGASLVVPAVSTAPLRPASATSPTGPSPVVAATRRARISYTCPHCGSPLEADAIHAGSEARCGTCGGRTIVPNRRGGFVNPTVSCFAPATIPSAAANRGAISVPILISAIANLVLGIVWISTCFGAVLGVPMLVLSIFEFIHYSKSDELSSAKFASKAETLGILEVIEGLCLNLVSLVCGILVLIHVGKYRKQTGLR